MLRFIKSAFGDCKMTDRFETIIRDRMAIESRYSHNVLAFRAR